MHVKVCVRACEGVCVCVCACEGVCACMRAQPAQDADVCGDYQRPPLW